MGLSGVKRSNGPVVHSQATHCMLLQNQEPQGYPSESQGPSTPLQAELRKAASTASMLAERSEISQEHLSLKTTHHFLHFLKFHSQERDLPYKGL
jgi:hypothetical protein